ncbi:MAG TPA: glycosyltransferase family 1 protein [Terracidiphilus sp.]|nr:glycosyltransferase family 1 protein [Terracidiphilus sp.]
MKILLAAASFSSSISGLQRHAFNLAHALLRQPEIASLHLAIAPWQANLPSEAGLFPNDRLSIHVAEMKRSSLGRNLWYYRQLPQLAASLGADLVHLTFPMPVSAKAFSAPTVVTLHDLYPYEIPANFGFPKFIFNRVALQRCLHNADAIACVSSATTRTLRQYTPAEIWRKAVRIYNCVEAGPPPLVAPAIPGWRNQPFLLNVAQHRRNKNLPLLIKAFARLLRLGQIDSSSLLLIVGMQGPETGRLHRLISGLRLEDRIHFLEGVSDAELQWGYRHCEALVAPSITEGFGLPVAEALLAGCRVVCSDIPAFREIGGTHCRYVSLHGDAEAALADAIVATLRQPPKPPLPLPQFSSFNIAQEYVSLYRQLIVEYATHRDTSSTPSIRATAPERPSL